MHLNTLNIFLVLCFSLCIKAQPPKRENQFLGYIITRDSVKTEVAIEVEDHLLPWTFQENIKYFDKSLMNGSRVKREQKKMCVPGEVIEYGFGQRRFLFVDYYVKGKDENNVLKTTFNKLKDEKNTHYFAEVIKEGEFTLLKFYLPPIISEEEEGDEEIVKKLTQEAKESFDILINKKGQEPKSIEAINFGKFFEDCPFVVKKYEDKRYKIKPSKGLKAMFSGDRVYGMVLENAAFAILEDYNLKCASKNK